MFLAYSNICNSGRVLGGPVRGLYAISLADEMPRCKERDKRSGKNADRAAVTDSIAWPEL